MSNRACQFMPFNGLRGFTDLLHEAEKPPVTRQEVTEDMANKLNTILNDLHKGDRVKITCFTSAGYVTKKEKIEEINPYLHYIRTPNGCISFRDILDMDILED